MNWKMCLCFCRIRVFAFFSRTEENQEGRPWFRKWLIVIVSVMFNLTQTMLDNANVIKSRPAHSFAYCLSLIPCRCRTFLFKTAVIVLVKAGVYVLNCLFNVITLVGLSPITLCWCLFQRELIAFETRAFLKQKNKNKLDWRSYSNVGVQ